MTIQKLSNDVGAYLYISRGAPDFDALSADGRIAETYDPDNLRPGDYTYSELDRALFLTGSGAVLWKWIENDDPQAPALIDIDGRPILCQCEFEDHFIYGTDAHRYASAPHAAEWIETLNGRFALCSACIEAEHMTADEEEEPSAPDEEDHILQDARSGGIDVWMSGKLIAHIDKDNPDVNASIAALRERDQYWPNAWQISDHGNSLLLSIPAPESVTVYVGALYWRDCDAFLSVIGFDQAAVNARLEECARDERERVNGDWEPQQCEDCDPENCDCGDSCDCDDPTIDDLCNTGAGSETLRFAIDNAFTEERDWRLSELIESGIVTL